MSEVERTLDERTCPVCGKSFFVTPKSRRKYCSGECSRQYNHEKYFRTYKPTPKVTKVCEHCGKKFVAKRKSQRFCSDGCAVAHWRGKRDETYNAAEESAKRVARRGEISRYAREAVAALTPKKRAELAIMFGMSRKRANELFLEIDPEEL